MSKASIELRKQHDTNIQKMHEITSKISDPKEAQERWEALDTAKGAFNTCMRRERAAVRSMPSYVPTQVLNETTGSDDVLLLLQVTYL